MENKRAREEEEEEVRELQQVTNKTSIWGG